MADVSQINFPDGSSYNVKDAIARSTKADKVAAPANYDSTSTYAEGDFVTYNGNIYICIYPITTAEAWNAYHWQLCTPQQDYLHSLDPVGNGSFSLNRKSGTTIGACSFAEGYNNTASDRYSHAEGYNTTASERGAHAEGWTSIASGNYSHAEGYNTTASGYNGSHAEGKDTIARGNSSHAEGSYTLADGNSSHAEGSGTTATHKSQHTFGEYNVPDTTPGASSDRGKYVEIVGNGTADNARSNARTLDWSGNEVLAGRLKVNGTQDVPIIYEVTQSQYDALKQADTLVHNALYVITDAQNLNATASDIEYSSGVTVYDKVNRMDTLDYYQVPTPVADNASAQIPAAVWAHRLIIINVRRYGYFGSMLVRKQNIVEGQLGASCCIYVSSSPKYFKVNETGLFTALTQFGTEGQWVDFIGIF